MVVMIKLILAWLDSIKQNKTIIPYPVKIPFFENLTCFHYASPQFFLDTSQHLQAQQGYLKFLSQVFYLQLNSDHCLLHECVPQSLGIILPFISSALAASAWHLNFTFQSYLIYCFFWLNFYLRAAQYFQGVILAIAIADGYFVRLPNWSLFYYYLMKESSGIEIWKDEFHFGCEDHRQCFPSYPEGNQAVIRLMIIHFLRFFWEIYNGDCALNEGTSCQFPSLCQLLFFRAFLPPLQKDCMILSFSSICCALRFSILLSKYADGCPLQQLYHIYQLCNKFKGIKGLKVDYRNFFQC